jgi:AcrR family transcriptional regulator
MRAKPAIDRAALNPAQSKPRRRTQQERSGETKRRLIEATIALLIERGYARLTTADIAKRAGVSNGARVHHYRTKEDLVVAANRRLYDDAVALGTQRAHSPGSGRDPVKNCFDDLISLYFGRWFLGSLDSVLAARTDKRLARRIHPIIVDYHSRIRAVWTKAFADAGWSRAEAAGAYDVILHTVRGMALTSVRQPAPTVNQRLVERVRRLLARG